LAKYVYENDLERFKHYAKAVGGIQTEDAKLAAEEAIERTVAYFKEIGMPTCISELGVGEVSDETLRELSNSVSVGDTLVLSHIRKLRMEDVYQIYRMANQ
jgi:alcohol dehydrogenase YqhD (iron-dependent ADH family)